MRTQSKPLERNSAISEEGQSREFGTEQTVSKGTKEFLKKEQTVRKRLKNFEPDLEKLKISKPHERN